VTRADPRWRLRLYSLIPVLAVIGITSRLYWNLSKGADLTLSDEADYLAAGIRFLRQGLPPNFLYSPLYAIWYAAHLALFGDPITAYYAQVFVVVMLTAILLYCYLRLLDVPRSLSVLGAVLWIAQPAYITVYWWTGTPRPYHFALLIFLAGAVALRKLKAESGLPLALGGIGFFLLAILVRGEYFASLLVFLLCLAGPAIRSRSQFALDQPRSCLWSASLLVGAAALGAWLYLNAGPVGHSARYGQAGRLWIAFGQHFSVYQLDRKGNAGLSPWVDWEVIMNQVFSGAHSLVAAAVTNPKAFAQFELHNLAAVPKTILRALTGYPYALMKALVVCLIFLWMTFFTSTGASLRANALLRCATALGPYAVSGAAAVFLSLLIGPYNTYLLPLTLVLFIAALKWLGMVMNAEPLRHKSLIGLSAAALSLILLVIPSPSDTGKNGERPAYAETNEIRRIFAAKGTRGLNFLDDSNYSAFLPYGTARPVDFDDRRANEPFWDFLTRANITAVLVDDSLRSSSLYRADPEFALFLRSPSQFGWTAEPVGLKGDVLYLEGSR